MKTLKVTEDKRYLSYSDGEPFFYMGDTAWELFHKLSKEEITHYFDVRKKQGFNVIQAVALAEIDGLRTPNAYGKTPLLKDENGIFDPTKPDLSGDYNYWDHLDFAVNEALKREMFIGLLPTWGDKYNIMWGKGPEIFDAENAYIYAKWIAERYKDYPNIIWILGGDRELSSKNHYDVIDGMGKGIREISNNQLITFHPAGGHHSAEFVNDRDYIDFHTQQSGHHFSGYDSYLMIRKMKSVEDKPFMDSEPRYEDHPAIFDDTIGHYWNASDVRNNTYWNMFEGVCGNTYGNHSIWQANTTKSSYTPYLWHEVLEHDGANQVKHAVNLRLSRDYFSLKPAYELVQNDGIFGNYMSAAKGDGYAFIYSPAGQPIVANLDVLDWDVVKVSWYNPRTGEETLFNILPTKKAIFNCPVDVNLKDFEKNDWVLILDKHGKKVW